MRTRARLLLLILAFPLLGVPGNAVAGSDGDGVPDDGGVGLPGAGTSRRSR